MALSRKARSGRGGRTRTRGKSQRAKVNDGTNGVVPDIFREMLDEVDASPSDYEIKGRAAKRRRVGERVPRELQNAEEVSSPPADSVGIPIEPQNLQTITWDSEESDETELEWEDVGLRGSGAESNDESGPADVSIVLKDREATQKRKFANRRPGITSAERSMRLDVHKMYICSLLYHVFLRNSFCNDHVVQVNSSRSIN
jgi:xeroderma pigmentosum group C-complementing protein